MGRATGMTDSGGTTWISNVQYGPSDEVLQKTRRWFNPTAGTFSTPTETRQYNALGQLTRITIPGFLDQEYDYSATKNNGRITQTIDHIANETITYTYDSLNRLSAATSSLGWSQTFTYDGFGNLTAENGTSAPSLSVNVDPNTNRLSGSSYVYDGNGNLTTASNLFSASYNVDNQIYVIPPNSGGLQYFYDQNGRRLWIGAPPALGEVYGAFGEHFQQFDNNDNCCDQRLIYLGTEPIFSQVHGGAGFFAQYSVAVDRLGSFRYGTFGSTNYYPYE